MSSFRLFPLLLVLALPACGARSEGPLPGGIPANAAAAATQRVATPAPSCLPTPCVYISSRILPGVGGAIDAFSSTANGNVPPVLQIAGKKTHLEEPISLTVGSDYTMYALDYGGYPYRVSEYAPGSDGNVTPIASIAGKQTNLAFPDSITVDPTGMVYVANEGNGSGAGRADTVTVYAAGANGNVPPIETITGPDTEFNNVVAIALDSTNNLYAYNRDTPSITVYAPGANGNVAPIRTITGSKTQLFAPSYNQMALDAADNIYVVGDNDILEYAAEADGNVAPIRKISGNKTRLTHSDSVGIRLDATGNIYVEQSLPGVPRNNTQSVEIMVFGANARGNTPPMQIIKGKQTKLYNRQYGGIMVR